MADLFGRYQRGGMSLLILILSLSVTFICSVNALAASEGSGQAGASELPTTAAAIVIVPNIVDIKARNVKIYGSGFIPTNRVTLEVVGVYKGKVYSGNDIVFAVTLPNKYGAFEETLGLRYITRYRVKAGPGVYTVRARSEDGSQVVTAPLVLTKGKKK